MPMAVPIGPMFLGPVMLVFVPLWFLAMFAIFREPHLRQRGPVRTYPVNPGDDGAGHPTARAQDHLHHAT